MPPFFSDFEKLHRVGRVKFIDIADKVFVYNARDSYLVQVENFKEFSQEVVKTTDPPVKTLILHTTYQCNIGCRHCYIKAGKQRPGEMTSSELSRIIREFGEMGGLGVDLSGGEALLKEGIEEVIQTAREQKLRTVVLTNAVDLDRMQLKKVSFCIDGIAVGLDGLYDANDKIRGNGSFKKTVRGLEIIADEEIELSITTLITPESLPQLKEFPQFIAKYGGRNWSLVMPRPSGRFTNEQEKINETYYLWNKEKRKGLLGVLQEETTHRGISVVLDHILVPGAKKKIEKTSKDFVYEIYNKGRACWDNTLTIMPNGNVKCCLFFDGQVYDNVRDKPLREVYESKQRQKALEEFKKYPVDKCPFLEGYNLNDFEQRIKLR